MSNYYNMLPIIIIDIFIILVFEGLLFFLYLLKEQEKIISSQLTKVLNNVNKKKQDNNLSHLNELFTYLKLQIDSYVQSFMKLCMNNEEQYINKTYINGIIFFITILVGLIITLLIYSYIVYNVLHRHIDWKSVLITVCITIGIIIYLEYLYVKRVLFEKKFNDSQITLDFINSISNEM